jgi:aryl-alcohol dehydrogenase-like predicted oxidoreductase
MRYRQLGSSGLTVSVVGLGCNNFGGRCDRDATKKVLDAAFDEGITLLDTADIYGSRGGSETLLGELIRDRRDEVVLATKFGGDMGGGPEEARGSRRYIRRAVEASLRRLQTDYIDLYQLHFPDPRTPIEETLGALHELVVEGKVAYVGSSNFSAWQVVESEWISRCARATRFISAQNHYSLLERRVEAELVPACDRYSVGLLPFFPLANGLLTGKYRRDTPPPEGTRLAARPEQLSPERLDKVEALERYAESRGVGVLDVAIGGLLARSPVVGSVIAGATRAEQVRANVAAGGWEPSAEDLAELAAVLEA